MTAATGTRPAEAEPVERGCGTRESSGIYFECGLSPYGRPVEEFLIDPPIPVPAALGLSPIGVTMTHDADGTAHILDWVGSEHYPNVADFVEEVRRFGLSRRLPSTLDFSKITECSRIVLAHKRAAVERPAQFFYPPDHTRYTGCCPQGHSDHPPFTADRAPLFKPCCIGFWWEDVDGGTPRFNQEGDDRAITREMPSFSYAARQRPDDVKPDYILAFFASFPASRLVVVKGNDHEPNLQKARAARLAVDEVDR